MNKENVVVISQEPIEGEEVKKALAVETLPVYRNILGIKKYPFYLLKIETQLEKNEGTMVISFANDHPKWYKLVYEQENGSLLFNCFLRSTLNRGFFNSFRAEMPQNHGMDFTLKFKHVGRENMTVTTLKNTRRAMWAIFNSHADNLLKDPEVAIKTLCVVDGNYSLGCKPYRKGLGAVLWKDIQDGKI